MDTIQSILSNSVAPTRSSLQIEASHAPIQKTEIAAASNSVQHSPQVSLGDANFKGNVDRSTLPREEQQAQA